MNFTSASIEALKPPPSGQIEFRDDTQRGLILRISQGGTKTWMMRYLKNGKRYRFALGRFPQMGLVDARKAIRLHLGYLAAGQNPAQECVNAAARTPSIRKENFEMAAL
jgi:hypothetical protein